MSTARPRPAVTGRALLLGTLVVLLLVLLASPLHRYFASRRDVGQAAQQLQDDRARLRELRAQLQQWSDPGYIQQQARQRLQFAMPGDTVYIVVKPGEQPDIANSAAKTVVKKTGTWNERLWNSVQAAGK